MHEELLERTYYVTERNNHEHFVVYCKTNEKVSSFPFHLHPRIKFALKFLMRDNCAMYYVLPRYSSSERKTNELKAKNLNLSLH